MVTLDDGGAETHIGSQDARQGMTTGYMRRVLSISVVLAVAAMLAAWLWIDRPSATVRAAPNAAASFPVGAQVLSQPRN